MDKLLTNVVKPCLFFLLFSCTDLMKKTSPNQLMDYWHYKIDLSKTERILLASSNIEDSNDDYLKAISHFIVGKSYKDNSEYGLMFTHFAKAEKFLALSGNTDERLLGHINRNMGAVAGKYGQYAKAAIYYDSALSHYNRLSNTFSKEQLTANYYKALALMNLNVKQSLQTFKEVLNEAKKNGNVDYEIKALRKIGSVYIQLKNYSEAETYIRKALSVFEKSGIENKRLHSYLLTSMNRIYFYTEQYDLQETYLRRALDLGIKSETFLLNVDLGENLMKQGRKQEAFELLYSLEKDFDQQSFNKDNLFIYDLLTLVSPESLRITYWEKEKMAREKYEAKEQAIIAQQQQAELQSIELQAVHQIEQDELKAAVANEKTEKITVTSSLGFLLLSILSISLVMYLWFKRRYVWDADLIQKLAKKERMLNHVARKYDINVTHLEKELEKRRA